MFDIGNQTWMCGSDHHFTTEFPNRENCVETWLPDLDDQIKDNATSSMDNNDFLGDKLDQNNNTISETALDGLPDSLNDILAKRENEYNNGTFDPNNATLQYDFFTRFMKNVDFLISADTWQKRNSSAFNISTAYIDRVVKLGDLYLKYSPLPCKY